MNSHEANNLLSAIYTRGIQKVCGPTMKEQRYEGHSKSFQISLVFNWQALLEEAYPKTLKNWNYQISQPVLSEVEVAKSGGPEFHL